MFEDIATAAVQMLILLFFFTLAFMMIFGALWMRSSRKNKRVL